MTKISEMPVADALDGTEEFAILQDGVNKRTPLITVPSWIKITKSYTDFAIPNTTSSQVLYSLPAKGIINGVIIKHNTAFTGGSISAYAISIGVVGSETQFVEEFDIFQATGDAVFETSTDNTPLNFSTADNIMVTCTSTGDDLDAATQGSVDIYLLLSTLP